MNNLKFDKDSLFVHAFNHAPIGMAIVGLDGRWLKVNSSLCKVLSYSNEELLSKTFQDITYQDDLDIDLEYASKLLDGQIDSYQMEKRYIHKSGHLVWALLSGSAMNKDSRLKIMLN